MYTKLLTIIIHGKLYRNVYKAMDNYNTQKTTYTEMYIKLWTIGLRRTG